MILFEFRILIHAKELIDEPKIKFRADFKQVK